MLKNPLPFHCYPDLLHLRYHNFWPPLSETYQKRITCLFLHAMIAHAIKPVLLLEWTFQSSFVAPGKESDKRYSNLCIKNTTRQRFILKCRKTNTIFNMLHVHCKAEWGKGSRELTVNALSKFRRMGKFWEGDSIFSCIALIWMCCSLNNAIISIAWCCNNICYMYSENCSLGLI